MLTIEEGHYTSGLRGMLGELAGKEEKAKDADTAIECGVVELDAKEIAQDPERWKLLEKAHDRELEKMLEARSCIHKVAGGVHDATG